MNTRALSKTVITFAAIVLSYAASAQVRQTPFRFPDAGEYKVLKADFHLHTVFSDGMVWPTARVEEAYAEDLDVIALTEHVEFRPRLNDISTTDHNRSYDVAKDLAERYGIVLIRSTEITRAMPPGHLNIIDIHDANVFDALYNHSDRNDTARVTEALREGKRQGGFIFWNHTAFPTPDNKSTWHPAHQRLVEQGLMMGIEVVNGERYEPIAFQWCLDHNLAIISNTDAHSTMAQKRAIDGFKVMTLVLARERTSEAVMDALRNRRTVALWNNQLMGRSEHVAPIVQTSVKAILHERGGQFLFEYVNESGFPFSFQLNDLPEGFRIRNDLSMTVNPYEKVAFTATVREEVPSSISVKVLNVWTTPDKNLEILIPVTHIRHN